MKMSRNLKFQGNFQRFSGNNSHLWIFWEKQLYEVYERKSVLKENRSCCFSFFYKKGESSKTIINSPRPGLNLTCFYGIICWGEYDQFYGILANCFNVTDFDLIEGLRCEISATADLLSLPAEGGGNKSRLLAFFESTKPTLLSLTTP